VAVRASDGYLGRRGSKDAKNIWRCHARGSNEQIVSYLQANYTPETRKHGGELRPCRLAASALTCTRRGARPDDRIRRKHRMRKSSRTVRKTGSQRLLPLAPSYARKDGTRIRDALLPRKFLEKERNQTSFQAPKNRSPGSSRSKHANVGHITDATHRTVLYIFFSCPRRPTR